MQYRDRINLSIHADLKDSYGAFAYFDAKELKRALSNLINNSAEAILDSGEISVSVKASETEIKIRVRDNGCGVPSDVIDRLGQKGFSYGKDSMPASGSGLGIWHAKRTVEEAGGNIKVKSREDGTLVEISLPKTPPPLWFIDELDLSHKAIVCILDDDMSIHNVWTTRIHSLLQTVHIQNFTSPLQFSEWYQLTRPANAIFLIDYEFLNQNINGLDLIEKLQISDRCVLVTSRSDDPAIQKRCLAVDQKMLPKSMAISIPIRT
jgi:anti-sigma regulatory factor (Ser/Thr protein kinase)